VGGEIAGGVSDVVYFVVSDANGFGSLQRVVFTNNTCANIDDTCGGTVADGVEAVQMAVYEWIPTPPAWAAVPAGPINTTNRLRVDLEMVVRAESIDVRPHSNIPLRLSPNACVPMPCGSNDFTERRVYRTSVEVKNSGFAQIR
jgi:hypothetical protein